MPATFTPTLTADLYPAATARILYADTDQMGIVYHASFFRYLELARINLLRSAGVSYTEFERAGLGLPLIEVGVRFASPGLYDDLITIHAGLSRITRVRVSVQYRVMVEAGDRDGTTEPVEILTAETRHCCVALADTKPARIPEIAYERLAKHRSAATPGG